MRTRLYLRSLVGSSLLLVFAATAMTGMGQASQNDDPTSQTIVLNLSKVAVSDVLMKLALKHQIAIGMEYSALDHDEPKLNIQVNGTVKNVLDSIVMQVPLYRWELRDGVVNFVPTQGRDPFLERLLSTRISRFAPEKGINRFMLRNTLADLPEVRQVLESANVTVNRISDYPYRPSIYFDKEADLSISDTDVRGVLNKLARDSENNLWLVGWRDKKKKELALGY